MRGQWRAGPPFYQWLKKEKPGLLGLENVKWNFTKFLIDRDGKVVDRFAPTTKPEPARRYPGPALRQRHAAAGQRDAAAACWARICYITPRYHFHLVAGASAPTIR